MLSTMQGTRTQQQQWYYYPSLAFGAIAGSASLLYTLERFHLLPKHLSTLICPPKPPSKSDISVDHRTYKILSSKFPQLQMHHPTSGCYHTVSAKGYAKMLKGRNDMFFQHTLIEGGQVGYEGFFANLESNVFMGVITYGHKICGNKGIIHGGMLAATFDEFFGGMVTTLVAPGVFTASLTIDYRIPVPADATYIWRGEIEDLQLERRKIWVKGTLEDGEGKVYTEGKALFVLSNKASKFSVGMQPAKPSQEAKAAADSGGGQPA